MRRESFFTRFELYCILSVRVCNVDSSRDIAEYLVYLKLLSRIIVSILLA